jgi:prevent-host-death family protein
MMLWEEKAMTAKKQNSWSVGEAKSKFSEVLKQSRNEPQRVFSDGKPAGAVISDDDYALLMSIKQDQTRSLIDDLIRVGKTEGVTEDTFENVKAPIKKITVE